MFRRLAEALGRLALRAPRLAYAIPGLRTRVLMYAVHHHGTRAARELLIPSQALATLRPPLVLGTFHIGPMHAFGAVLASMPGETLVLRRQAYEPAQPANVSVAETEGTEEERAVAFTRAVVHLRKGGFVFLTLDPMDGTRIAAPFMGRTLNLARGGFALARLARVPLVPLIARWHGMRIEIVAGAPVEVTSEEQAAAEVARWLEQYLRAHPDEMTERTRELIGA